MRINNVLHGCQLSHTVPMIKALTKGFLVFHTSKPNSAPILPLFPLVDTEVFRAAPDTVKAIELSVQ